MWTIFISVCAAILSLGCLAAAAYAVQIAKAATEFQPVVKCSCASQVASLKDSLAETQSALELLANRVKMMRVRNAATHTDPQSDLTSADPASLKHQLRLRAGLIAGRPAKHS